MTKAPATANEFTSTLQNINTQANTLQRPNPEDSTYAEIELNGGESFKFIVDVQVPKGTPFNIWNCVQVEAKSTDCTTSPETETLSVFVVDPREG